MEFLLSPTRDAEAAKRFFSKTLAASQTVEPRVITVDKNAAYPKAFNELKAAETLASPLRVFATQPEMLQQEEMVVFSHSSKAI